MKRRGPLALAALCLTLIPPVADAQDPRVQELERQLKERDKVILELLERVEALERRVGLERATAESSESPVELPREAGVLADKKEPSEGVETAPGTVVVDEEAAERALERSLTRAGALLLGPGQAELEPSLSYARNENATPTFVSVEGSTFAGQRERNADSLTAALALRIGLPWDSQAELGIPYRWRNVENLTAADFSPLETSSDSGSGLGDIRVGVARTLLREGVRRPDLVGRLTWDTDTGEDVDDGVSLGGGFHELRGSLTAIKRQDPIVFAGSLGYEYAFEADDVKPGDVISSSFGGFIALSPETSLRLLLAGAYQEEAEVLGSPIDGSDQVLATFVIGGSSLVAPGFLLDVSAGIGLTDDADDFSIRLSAPIRFGPGGR